MMFLLPMVASADDSGYCGNDTYNQNLTWTFTESTKTLTISGTGGMRRYDNNTRKAPWYQYISDIENVIIEEGVTSIGECAFRSGSNINSLTVPSSLTLVQDRAFLYCSIKNIYITSLEAWCNINFEEISSSPHCDHFYLNGTELYKVVIPDGITSLNGTFSGFKGIISVKIPESVISIGHYAFYGCEQLTSIVIPKNVKSIGEYNQEIKGETNVEIIPVSA